MCRLSVWGFRDREPILSGLVLMVAETKDDDDEPLREGMSFQFLFSESDQRHWSRWPGRYVGTFLGSDEIVGNGHAATPSWIMRNAVMAFPAESRTS